jgi:hypothetical protein
MSYGCPNPAGLGIGLTLVQRIAESSTAAGPKSPATVQAAGSTFTFRLPSITAPQAYKPARGYQARWPSYAAADSFN